MLAGGIGGGYTIADEVASRLAWYVEAVDAVTGCDVAISAIVKHWGGNIGIKVYFVGNGGRTGVTG